MTKDLCTLFRRLQPFLSTNKLDYCCSKSLLTTLRFRLLDVQLYYVVHLYKRQKSEALRACVTESFAA